MPIVENIGKGIEMFKVKISVWLESPDGDRLERTYIEEVEGTNDIDIAHEIEVMIPDLVFWDWKHIEDEED